MKPFLTPATVFAALVLTAVAAGGPAVAQSRAAPTPMPGAAMPMQPGAGATDGSMMAAMEKMSKDMAAAPMTGDADQDFVAMMIPHHQGAIDMAKYELAHGKDPATRKLARDIVAAQEREIAGMKAWQAKHPAGR